jgi:hypothetical protein
VGPGKAGGATVNVHAGIVLPEKNSVPSPRVREQFQRAATVRRFVSLRVFPARRKDG